MVRRWSTVRANVFALPGRVAQTWGPTYLTTGRLGWLLFSLCATRRVKPQESIRTAISGFSRAARRYDNGVRHVLHRTGRMFFAYLAVLAALVLWWGVTILGYIRL